MKGDQISFKVKSSDKNIYNIDPIIGNFNAIQNEKYYFSTISLNDGKYEAEISNNDIEGISNLVLEIELPEIKGYGRVAYNRYFGYGLIDKFTILMDNNIFMTFTGSELLDNYLMEPINPVVETLMGNDPSWLTFKGGNGYDSIIYPRKRIMIPLKLFFNSPPPLAILRIPIGTKLTFKLRLEKLSSVLNYDRQFKFSSLDIRPIDKYQPALNIVEYNTIDSPISHRFFYQYEESIHPGTSGQYFTPRFKSILKLEWFIKTTMYSGENSFIVSPSYDSTEKTLIKEYEKKILSDMLRVAPSLDDFKNQYPKQAEFKEVINNIISFKEKDSNDDKISEDDHCIIEILNIPPSHKLFYHTNILTFSRRNGNKIDNISKKFRLIQGRYYPVTNTIKFDEIISDITLSNVSTPNELWSQGTINTSPGDLRSDKFKESDIFINNKFLHSFDFLGKESGIESISIKGGSYILNDSNSTIIPSITPTIYGYPHKYELSFNNHDINYIEPSRLRSKPSENFDRCSLLPKFREFDINDIRKLIPYNFHIGMVHAKKLFYTSDSVSMQDV